MKTATKLPIASILLGLALSPSVFSQSVLVAGWDFNNGTSPLAVSANYSDAYISPYGPNDASGAASRGSYLANGTFGSELLPTGGPSATAFTSAANADINQAITTRVVGSVGDKLGYLGGTQQAIAIPVTSALSPQTFAFSIDSTGIENLSLSVWVARGVANNLSIDWGYKTGSGSFVSLGAPTNIVSTAGTFQNYIVDYSAIAAVDNQSQISLIGMASSTSTVSAAMRIDNVGIYGELTAIPEPSTYALLIGGAAFAVVTIRRRFQIA